MTDEIYVRSKWIDVSISNYHQYGKVELPVYWEIRFADGIAQSGYDTAAKAWSAAAEFTRRRLEQIRQVECEVDCLETSLWGDREWGEFFEYLREDESMGDVVLAVRQQCVEARILARELQVLAELKRGLRPEEDFPQFCGRTDSMGVECERPELEKRISTLQEQIDTAKAELAAMTADRNLYRDDHDGEDHPYSEVVALKAEITQLRAALEWTPITLENLPKVGDEVWGDPVEYEDFGVLIRGGPVEAVEDINSTFSPQVRFEAWLSIGYTHRRAIGAPAPARKEHGNG